MGKNRQLITSEDRQGAVFAPVAGKGQRLVYQVGPEKQAAANVIGLFTCPVSAIPGEVWDLLSVWNSCRLLGVLPKPGGLLDQPVLVQRYFPILQAEHDRATAIDRQMAQAGGAAAMMGAVAKGLKGG